MANTNTDILLEDLEDVLDDATSIPLSKKYAVDIDKIKTIIEDIRLNTPQEIKQAKAIVNSRNTILEEAKNEAAEIIKKAQEDARELVARDEITKTAQAEAADIIAKANEQGKQMVTESQNQASEILSTESISGRYVMEEFEKFSESNPKLISQKRLAQLKGYREYGYMRKRWTAACKKVRKEKPWEDALDIIVAFLEPVWNALCNNEIFFDDWMPELGRYLG